FPPARDLQGAGAERQRQRRALVRYRLPQQPDRGFRRELQSRDAPCRCLPRCADSGGLCAVRDPERQRRSVRDLRQARRRPQGRRAGTQNVNGDLYVTYAKQDADRKDDVPGPGFGYVDIYDPDGKLLRRFAAQGALNAPWGIALAPAGFGRASGRLLIGNFGDGRIDAYDFASGLPVGPLGDAKGNPIQIDGLWGLAFGNGYSSQSVNSLYFTAGPNDEADGLYGRLDPAK